MTNRSRCTDPDNGSTLLSIFGFGVCDEDDQREFRKHLATRCDSCASAAEAQRAGGKLAWLEEEVADDDTPPLTSKRIAGLRREIARIERRVGRAHFSRCTNADVRALLILFAKGKIPKSDPKSETVGEHIMSCREGCGDDFAFITNELGDLGDDAITVFGMILAERDAKPDRGD